MVWSEREGERERKREEERRENEETKKRRSSPVDLAWDVTDRR